MWRGLFTIHLLKEILFEGLCRVYGPIKFASYIHKALCKCCFIKRPQYVKLNSLTHDHPIDNRIPSSLKRQLDRALMIDAYRKYLFDDHRITIKTLQDICPSTTPLLCFKEAGRNVIYDGNGRLFALREALGGKATYDIEVMYHTPRWRWVPFT